MCVGTCRVSNVSMLSTVVKVHEGYDPDVVEPFQVADTVFISGKQDDAAVGE